MNDLQIMYQAENSGGSRAPPSISPERQQKLEKIMMGGENSAEKIVASHVGFGAVDRPTSFSGIEALRPNVNAATPTRGPSAQDRTTGILDSPDSSSSELADIVSPLRNHAGGSDAVSANASEASPNRHNAKSSRKPRTPKRTTPTMWPDNPSSSPVQQHEDSSSNDVVVLSSTGPAVAVAAAAAAGVLASPSPMQPVSAYGGGSPASRVGAPAVSASAVDPAGLDPRKLHDKDKNAASRGGLLSFFSLKPLVGTASTQPARSSSSTAPSVSSSSASPALSRPPSLDTIAPMDESPASGAGAAAAMSGVVPGVVADGTKGRKRQLPSAGTAAKPQGKRSKKDPGVVNLSLKEEKEQLDARAAQVEAEYSALHEKEQSLERRIRELEGRAASVESEAKRLSETKSQQDQLQGRLREVLVSTLTDLARKEKAEQEQELIRSSFTMGRITARRDGHMVNDYWEDGELFVQLLKRQEEIKAEQEEVEKARKELTKKRTTATKASKKDQPQVDKDSTGAEFKRPAVPVFDDFSEMDEILKLRTTLLKKELTDLETQQEELEGKKKRLIRFFKLMEDEKRSQWNHHPTLHDRFLLLRMLGKGGFSEVYKAFDLKTLEYVAVKIHQLNDQWTEDRKHNYIRHATREYEIHKALDHPRVVKFHEVFGINDNAFCTVMEYCEGPDLDLYLKIKQTLTDREARVIIMQVFSGLRYMNEQKQRIIHFDLKPGNVIYHQGVWKLTDFGLSKIVEEHHEMIELTSQGAGTYWYLPPECFQIGGKAMISSKVDVWSAGVMLFQLLTGKRPFGHGMSQESILSQNTIANAREVRFPDKPVIPDITKDFIRKCLSFNPADRPDVRSIFNEPYLRQRTRNA